MTGSAGENSRIGSSADAGRLLRDARHAAGTTQQELADRIGMSRQWVSRLERGEGAERLRPAFAAFAAVGLTLVAEYEVPPPRQKPGSPRS